MSKKWTCEICNDKLPTKRKLVEHLVDHYEWASQEADIAESQLEDLDRNWRDKL